MLVGQTAPGGRLRPARRLKQVRTPASQPPEVALISGADSGFGRAVALAFAREGADVVVSYLDEHENARVTCRIVEQAGRRFVDAPGDIGDERHSRALVERYGGHPDLHQGPQHAAHR